MVESFQEDHVKTNQFSAEQIVKILEQAERPEASISAICREHGISETTFYRWRHVYGSMSVNETQRLKELEKENARLKRLLVAVLQKPFALARLREVMQGVRDEFPSPVA